MHPVPAPVPRTHLLCSCVYLQPLGWVELGGVQTEELCRALRSANLARGVESLMLRSSSQKVGRTAAAGDG